MVGDFPTYQIMKLTAKKARIVNKITLLALIISSASSAACVIFSSGVSDFWTMEKRTIVPGDLDMRFAKVAIISGAIAIMIHSIRKRIDFSNMKKLEGIPVYLEDGILERAEHNKSFEIQLKKLLKQFYEGIYGDLSTGDKLNNKKAMERGKGRVIGEYRTIYGRICIVTNADRTKTEITLPEIYYKNAA